MDDYNCEINDISNSIKNKILRTIRYDIDDIPSKSKVCVGGYYELFNKKEFLNAIGKTQEDMECTIKNKVNYMLMTKTFPLKQSYFQKNHTDFCVEATSYLEFMDFVKKNK